MANNQDKAGLEYWNTTGPNTNVEVNSFAPAAGVRGYGRRLWHQLFQSIVSLLPPGRRRIMELGCGGSDRLPYFSKQYGLEVSGLDYSERGVELAQKMCLANGVTPTLYCADLFRPPAECIQAFDVVVSFGVVEHFTDTDKTVLAFAEFVRPGGLLLTTCPNMQGLTGFGQRMLSRKIFDIHEAITPQRLRVAHETVGLEVLQSDYFMFSNFGVINPGSRPNTVKRLVLAALRAVTGTIWAGESMIGGLPSNRFTSPYVFCLARKAQSPGASDLPNP